MILILAFILGIAYYNYNQCYAKRDYMIFVKNPDTIRFFDYTKQRNIKTEPTISYTDSKMYWVTCSQNEYTEMINLFHV